MSKKTSDEGKVSDATTQGLIDGGVFSVRGQAHERPAPASISSYSIASGVKYTFFLSLFLWWFPMVGNMAAGYVGGRRSGAAWKGIVAASIPLFVIWCFNFCRDHGLVPTLITTIVTIPDLINSAVVHDIPVLVPYYQAAMLYITAFLVFLQSILQYQVNMYIVTIVFAYLGGAVSELRQREYAMYGGSSSANVTLNLFNHKRDRGDGNEPSSSNESEPEPNGGARPRKVHAPKVRADMIPTGLRSYPNWRRRRLKGETDSEIVAPITRRQLDPVERLDREGIRARASERQAPHAAHKKAKAHKTSDAEIVLDEEDEEPVALKAKMGDEEEEGDGSKEGDEEKDENGDEKKRIGAVDRAIARYMQGGKPVASSAPASHQERNWDVL